MAGVVVSGVAARAGAGARASDRCFALAAEHNDYYSQAAMAAGWLVAIIINQEIWAAEWSIAIAISRAFWEAGCLAVTIISQAVWAVGSLWSSSARQSG